MSEMNPYAGIATFLQTPFVAEPTAADGHVAVVGVPYDEGTTSRPGARYGPRALRDVSTLTATARTASGSTTARPAHGCWTGCASSTPATSYVPPTAQRRARHARIAARLQALVGAGLFPIVLGGDHSITYPVLRVWSPPAAASACIWCSSTPTWTTGTTRAACATRTPAPIVRAHERRLADSASRSTASAVCTRRPTTSSWRVSAACTRSGAAGQADAGRRARGPHRAGRGCLVTFDIDALDPGIAPGTGTPEPGGFTYYEAKAILRAVAARAHVIGHGHGGGQSTLRPHGDHGAARRAPDLRLPGGGVGDPLVRASCRMRPRRKAVARQARRATRPPAPRCAPAWCRSTRPLRWRRRHKGRHELSEVRRRLLVERVAACRAGAGPRWAG